MTDSNRATNPRPWTIPTPPHPDEPLFMLATAYVDAQDALERASIAEGEVEDRFVANRPPVPDVLQFRETDRLALGRVGAIPRALKHYGNAETIAYLEAVYLYEGCHRPADEIARAHEIVEAYGPYVAAEEAANVEAGIPAARQAWEGARDEAKRLRADLIAMLAKTLQGAMAKARALWRVWGSAQTPDEELADLINSGDTDAESLAGLSVIRDLMAVERPRLIEGPNLSGEAWRVLMASYRSWLAQELAFLDHEIPDLKGSVWTSLAGGSFHNTDTPAPSTRASYVLDALGVDWRRDGVGLMED